MAKATRPTFRRRALPESRLTHHLRCRREQATDPELTALERLALTRNRAEWIREVQLAHNGCSYVA